MMNKIFTIGRLTKDPELREVSGVPCLNFTLASDTRNKDADGNKIANFYSVTAWRQAAQTMAQYLHKGDKISVVGDVLIRQYKDNNGMDRTSVQITVSDFEFLETKRDGNAAAPAQAPATSRNNGYSVPQTDELPF